MATMASVAMITTQGIEVCCCGIVEVVIVFRLFNKSIHTVKIHHALARSCQLRKLLPLSV